MRKIYLALFLILTFCASSVYAQRQTASTLQLSDKNITLHTDIAALIKDANQSVSQNGMALFYLRFNKTPDKLALNLQGIQLESILQADVYIASISKNITPNNFGNTGIVAWSTTDAQEKINPQLKIPNIDPAAEKELLVAFTKSMTRVTIQQALSSISATLLPEQLWKDQNVWEVKMKQSDLLLLAQKPFVLSVTPLMTPQPLDNEVIGVTNTQGMQQPTLLGGHDLHGNGVTIGVGDNSDPTHIDYIDRITAFNPIFSTDHGFLTTGIAGGNGLVDERYKGFSNKANIVSDFFSQVISNAVFYLNDFNMVVSNNSYGNILGNCGYAGTYDVYSQYTDQQMRDHPTLLHVFAAANDGLMTCSPFPFGYATITGSFSSAKNELTVGGVPKRKVWLGPNPYSSKGPVKDGRIKPEITSIGDRVYSTGTNNDYLWGTGTSMASPSVAGAAGLVYQRYRQLNGNQDPKSALVKNLLMNGAVDFGTAGPDYAFGFGMMNMGHTITNLDSNRIFTNTINTNIEQTYTFTIPANTFKAKVMLNWNDPAAAPLSAVTLINDLDLTVTSPSNVVSLPLILNPNPANVLDPAVPGADHTNNVEQVTLNNPVAGTYTIKVKGFNVPEPNQEYFVTYDYSSVGVNIQYPFGGEALLSGDSTILFWEASDDTNPFTLSYSINNGGTWLTIDNNVPANYRDYTWNIPAGINTNQCMVRVSRNNTTQTSQSKRFTLAARPVIALNTISEQCPGSIKINWPALSGISSYTIFKKSGIDMMPVATISGTSYTFTGLSQDSTYWVAVAPVVNGAVGMRSVAISRKPNDGGCVGITTHGDLSVTSVISPSSGRLLTSTALSASVPLKVTINNLDNLSASQYRISYKINNGAWLSFNYINPLAPISTNQITVDNLNLAAAGDYKITVAVTNTAQTDIITGNDTTTIIVKQIDNPPMNLSGGYTDGFETNNIINLVGKSMMGLDSNTKWDFTSSQSRGRIKNFLSSSITISGNRSMSLDNDGNQYANIAGSSYNTLTGTFNLSNYNAATSELRCDFDYVMSGYPKFDTGNSVWVRGSDTDPWIHLMDYQIDTVTGAIFHSGSLQLSDILLAAGQSFSTSTQIKFTQYDTSRIEAQYYGNGVTMDNFRLYTVTDDVAILAIDSVYHYNCGLSDAVPLRVKVVNNVNNTVHNIALSYKLDNNAVVTQMLDSIPGNDTVIFTFNQTINLLANTSYQLNAWLYVATDTYHLNDSIVNYGIQNQPIITAFPYLQNFELSDGYFYSDGSNSSWQYGRPASPQINHAASGTKAWKTSLAGNYNHNEFSFLYSPCFNVSTLANPTLSFNIALDIEAPSNGSIFDKAYVEYTNDGNVWTKLGAQGEGTNWYNNDTAQAWTERGATYWHVATIPLPKTGPIVSFRFVIHSDQGTEYEGVAIDDIHVYDLIHPIFDQNQFATAITQNVGANQQADYMEANHIGASIINSNIALGNTTVQDYKHQQYINPDSTQYYVPKNFTIQSANAPGDSVTVRFYIPDSAIQVLRDDNICISCSPVFEVQSLGITKYDDADKNVENNTLTDNVNGTYSFIPQNKITWVPYDVGYYAIVKFKSFSEFWFNNGGPTHDQILTSPILDFTVQHAGARFAQLNWSSSIDASIAKYELEESDDAIQFGTFGTVNALAQNGHPYSFTSTTLNHKLTMYYRIKYILTDGSEHYSMIRSLDWDGTGGDVVIFPNPSNGIISLNWFKGNGDGLKWVMYNSVGKRLFDGYTEENTYNGTHQFDLSKMAIAHGIYILKVMSGKQEWQFKIVYE